MASSLGNRKLRAAMMAVLFLAPMLFGTVEPWSIALIESAAVALLLMYARLRMRRGGEFYRVPGIMPLGFLTCLMLVQVVPIPEPLLSFISPSSSRFYSETLGRLVPDFWAPISLNPRATLLELLRLLAYASFYVLAVQMLSKSERLKKTVRSLALFAGVLAFISIINHYAGNGRIMWLRLPPAGDVSFFGPYVSRNHFAGLMIMLCPLLAAMFFVSRPRVKGGSLGEQMAEAASDRSFNRHILYASGAAIVCLSVFASLSRGGILSLCAALAVLGILIFHKEPSGSVIMWFWGLGILGVVIGVGWLGWEPIVARFGGETLKDTVSVSSRLNIWSDTVRMIKDFPLFGAGFGAYGSVYPAYSTLAVRLVVDHAHSDPLELLAEGGVVGFGLALWFLFSVAKSAYQGAGSRRNPYSHHLTSGALAGVLAFLVHGLVDFNLHIGANGLVFFFMLGLAVSAGNTRMRESHGRTLLPKAGPPTRLMYAAAVTAFIIISANALILLGITFGTRAMNFDASKGSREELAALGKRLSVSTLLDPLNAGYWFGRANAVALTGEIDSAIPYYRKSLRLSPMDARYMMVTARVLSRKGDVDTARALMETALRYGDRRFDPALNYSAWLLEKGWFDDAVRIARKGMTDEPSESRRYFDMMRRYHTAEAELLAVAPETPMHMVMLGRYLAGLGYDNIAEDAMRRAFDLLDSSRPVPQAELYHLSDYFNSTGRGGYGLEVLRIGVQMHPQDPNLRSTLAVSYEREGYPYQARLEYERVMMLRPGDKNAEARAKALAGFTGK